MSLPKTFAAGERLFAADLNSNFEHVEDAKNILVSSADDTGSPWNLPYPDGGSAGSLAKTIEDLAEATATALSNAVPSGAFVYTGTIYYTSNGTFSKADPFGTGDIGLKAIRVRLVAGGGGTSGLVRGGGTGGGGGGGYAESFIVDIAGLSSTVTVTRGAGGTGITGEGTGGTGGTSSFGSLVVATGGTGSVQPRAGIQNGGAGGVGTAGNLLIRGTGGGAGAAETIPWGGAGGSSQLGGGAHGTRRYNTGIVNAIAGGLYGGGASGASSTGAAASGASGANGIVIVVCFV